MNSEDGGGGLLERAGNWVEAGREAVGNTARAVRTAVDFGSDPLGFLFDKTQEAAHGLSSSVLPTLFDATQPDLSAEWFLDAYRVSFALGVFLWAFLLLVTVVRSAQGVYSSNQVADVLTRGSVLFLGGAMFGPAAGWFVLEFVGSLSDVIAKWAIESSTDEVVSSISEMVADSDASGVTGGVVVALCLMVLMLVGLVLVIAMLIVTMVTIYIGGAVVPIALAWYASPDQRRIATRLLMVLGGVIAAKPVLFLVLGLAYRLAASQAEWLSDTPDVATLANHLAAACALCLAGLTPFLLFRFAPVLPTTAGQAGPALSMAASDGPSGGGWGGSETARRAKDRAQRSDAGTDSGDDGGPDDGSDNDAGGDSAGSSSTSSRRADEGGTIQKALEAKQQAASDGQGGDDGDAAGKSTSAGGSTTEAAAAKGSAAGSDGAAATSSSSNAAAGSSGAAAGAAVAAGAVAVVATKKAADFGTRGGEIAAAEMDEDPAGGAR
ncbi:type IV secretion system protein [Georgenia sp. EYE_87]|uniref:type IV secretion system protein n=1 Tax=Georgenia sp. EYE_87 TaxID=2853448 RepID=UPI002006A382|nr:type IV secretion system protein [Georgenia sp. EYE_87]MCK6210564.1 type IV secretion system protein [Georgenia sp. EYE_87]